MLGHAPYKSATQEFREVHTGAYIEGAEPARHKRPRACLAVEALELACTPSLRKSCWLSLQSEASF